MEIVGKVAATIQNVLGPCPGTWAGDRCYPTSSKVHRRQLVADARPDSAQKTGCQGHLFPSTAAQLGLDVTSTAVEHRFTPHLVRFLRAVLDAPCSGVAASPQTVHLLNTFTSVRIGDRSTIALPDQRPTSSPAVAASCAGLAAMKIHLLWDFLTGSILQLRSPPARQRRYQPDRPVGRPAGRCRCSTWATSVWIGSRTSRGRRFLDLSAQHGTSVFTPASPFAVQYLRQQRVYRSTCLSCWA